MGCSCKTVRRTEEVAPLFLAKCTSCKTPIETYGGMLVPVHLVEIPVTKQDIDLWTNLGYEIEVKKL